MHLYYRKRGYGSAGTTRNEQNSRWGRLYSALIFLREDML